MELEEKLPLFLITMLKEQYGEELLKEIIKGYNSERKVTFRVNTIKTDKEKIKEQLTKSKIEFEQPKWSEDCFIINNVKEKEIKNLSFYEKGEIYLQSLSSMLPPIIMKPNEKTDILDMAAAPGGKTTQIAALTQNKAHITACEINSIRYERLKYNVEKQGATSVYIMKEDSRKINDLFSFDQILLDAPCSGSGTININDINLEKTFTKKLLEKSISSQQALLKKALKILKPGHEMIYSTCSILSCENEEIIEKALKETKAQIVPIEFEGKDNIPLLPSKIEGTLCVMPTELYEGFFVAKIKKVLLSKN